MEEGTGSGDTAPFLVTAATDTYDDYVASPSPDYGGSGDYGDYWVMRDGGIFKNNNCTRLDLQTKLEHMGLDLAADCCFLFILLIFLLIFGWRHRFQTRSNIWLFMGCVTAFLWLLAKIIQDYSGFSGKCAFTEAVLFFSKLFGCFLHGALSFDRYIAVCHGTKTRGSSRASPWKLLLLFCVICSILTGTYLWDLGSFNQLSGDYGLYRCAPSATLEGYQAKKAVLGIFYLFCVLVTVVLTVLILRKLFKTASQKTKEIALNIVLVTGVTCLIWLLGAGFALKEATSAVSLCPVTHEGNADKHVASLLLVVLLVLYVLASSHLRSVLLLTKRQRRRRRRSRVDSAHEEIELREVSFHQPLYITAQCLKQAD